MHLSAEPSLLHTCTTHAQCIAWLTVYDCSIRSIELHTLHLNIGMVLFSWRSRTRGKAPGYVTIQTESFCDIFKLNYALESQCLFTLSLH